jgi:hypothetical protein
MEQLRRNRSESAHRRAFTKAIRAATTPAQRGELVELASRYLNN